MGIYNNQVKVCRNMGKFKAGMSYAEMKSAHENTVDVDKIKPIQRFRQGDYGSKDEIVILDTSFDPKSESKGIHYTVEHIDVQTGKTGRRNDGGTFNIRKQTT